MQKLELTKEVLSHPHTRQAAALIKALHAQGISMADIAQRLNANSFETAIGKQFGEVEVKEILDRMEDVDRINVEMSGKGPL